MLHTACQLFMGKPERQIQEIAKETLEGHQRAIMGTMTVEVSEGFIICIQQAYFIFQKAAHLEIYKNKNMFIFIYTENTI